MTKQEADQKCSELFQLMKPHVGSNIMQRVGLYVNQKTGQKFPDFAAHGEPELRGQIIGELIEIVKGNKWDLLPVVPNGQASAKTPTPAPAPVVKTPPVVPAPVVVPPPPKPEPVVPKPEVVVPPVVVLPTPVVAAPVQSVAVIEEEEETAEDPLAIITAQLAKLNKPSKPGLTEVEARKIVRNELAIVFKTLAEVLAK